MVRREGPVSEFQRKILAETLRTIQRKMRHELVFLAKWSVAVGIAFLINQGLMYAAVHESQGEALSQASSMPLGSILVVAFFGPGWLLLFGDNDKQQKIDR